MVKADGRRHQPARREANQVFSVDSCGTLSAARTKRGRGAPVEEPDLVTRAANFHAVEPGQKRLLRSERPTPLQVNASLLSRHALGTRQRFAVAVCRHGGERLVKEFRPSEASEGKRSRLLRNPVCAEGQPARVSAIVSERRTVGARFAEVSDLGKHSSLLAEFSFNGCIADFVLRPCSGVNRPAIMRVHQNVAIRVEGFAIKAELPRSAVNAGPEG